MTWVDVWDSIRILELVIGAATIGLTLLVVIEHWKRHRGSKGAWKRILPRHVYLAAVSYVGLLLWAMEDMMRRFHDTPSWRLPALLVLASVGFWAMRDVATYQRLMTRRINPEHADQR